MGIRDPWTFLILVALFSAAVFLVTVLIAQLETYVPTRKVRSLPGKAEEEKKHHHNHDQDEPTAA